MNLHPQVIEKGGKGEFVVLPIEEYQALVEVMEDYEDLRDLRESKKASHGEKSIPLERLILEME